LNPDCVEPRLYIDSAAVHNRIVPLYKMLNDGAATDSKKYHCGNASVL